VKHTILLITIILISCQSKEPPSDTNIEAQEAILSPPITDETQIDTGGTVPIDVLEGTTGGEALPTVSEIGFTSECEGDEDPADADLYCTCNPQCCEQQQWYCPPRPDNEIHRMRVTVTICDEANQPCDFGIDEGCPPPQIIKREPCELAFECPPNTEVSRIQWFDCELADGRFGMQRVVCNKGRLIHGPCQPCRDELCDGEDNDCDYATDEGRYACENECGTGWGYCIEGQVVDCDGPSPGEEICDHEDNDCDRKIDEGQRNVCNRCGLVPEEDCNAVDDDCDGSIDEELVRECMTDCEAGLEYCVSGNWVSCTATPPVEEECDGLDTDCDGTIDEGLNCLCSPDDIGALFPCKEPPLICGQGYKTCECVNNDCTNLTMTECRAMCTFLTEVPPECDPRLGMVVNPEDCNNYDEDCDSLIDENLLRMCYSGPEETIGIGVCTPGSQICDLGVWGGEINSNWTADVCEGEILPSDEVCDGADNDCDGVTDYGLEVRDTDILFIIDYSGSMEEEISAVLIAMNTFAQEFAAEDKIKWGLVGAPVQNDTYYYRAEILSDIADFEDFMTALAVHRNLGGGNEPTQDALLLSILNITSMPPIVREALHWRGLLRASVPPIMEWKPSWRSDADRIIIIFTDEEEQTYLTPLIEFSTVIDAADNTPRLKVYTFSNHTNYLWDELAAATDGTYYELVTNATQMYNNLMEIIDQICLPHDGQQARTRGLSFGNYQLVAARYNYKLQACMF